MASPEMFLSSPSRPKRRTATSPLVISSSPDLPSLQSLGSRPPKPPIFKSPTPTTPPHTRSQSRFTPAPDARPETVDLLSTSGATVHESQYRSPNKDRLHGPLNVNDMGKKRADQDTARVPFLLSSSPTTIPHAALTESKYFKKLALERSEPNDTTATAKPPTQYASLNIERAPARRLDWTPPKQKSSIIIDPETVNPVATPPVGGDTVEDSTLSKVLEAFKCDDILTTTGASRSDEDGSIFRKRKLVDAVLAKSEQSRSVAPEPVIGKKKPAVKKKPRTITGLATAAYKLASQPDPNVGADTQPKTSKADVQGAATEPEQKGPAKKTRKRAAKAPRKTKKKEAPPKPLLLSPSAALRQVANQDFLFGTSSQLAQEHSPGFLRDLAAAMKTSNEIDYVTIATPINSDAIEPPKAKRSLWNAAARDEDGELFDLGVQELAQKSQELPVPPTQADPFGYVRDASPTGDDSFLTLSDALQPQQLPIMENANTELPSSVPGSQEKEAVPAVPASLSLPPRPNFELYTDAQLASAVSAYGFKNVRQRGARIALLEKCWQGKNHIGAVTGVRSASTLTGSVPRSPVKSSRAKSTVKTPARPESSLVSASQPQEPPPSAQQPMSPPKRLRGRPRKSPVPTPSLSETVSLCAAAMLQPGPTRLTPSTPKRNKATSSKIVVEIPDSESELDEIDALLSDSPSSVPDETFSPSQGVDLSLSMEEDTELSIAVSPRDEPASFEYISKAVTSAPRTKDVGNPSWHEKILMYDPIILEDLTIWLNCGPLTQAGYDDEVSSAEVKKWCESKSICCLWKVNLRGKERKRY